MTDRPIRLLIADDHRIVREGIKAFLAPSPSFEVIGEAADGEEAVALAASLQPDVIILDLVMPRLDGIEAARRIRQADPRARILIITSFVEEAKVLDAIKAGAAGYLLKDSSPQEIETAIQEIYHGRTAFPSWVAAIMVKEISRAGQPPVERPALTEREVEILKLIAQGLSNQEIADRLFLSVWTVRSYVAAVMAKLQVENRTQAALYAIRMGIASLDNP